MKRLLVLVDNLERARFFARFGEASREMGHELRFLCYRRSAFRLLRSHGHQVQIFRRNENHPANFDESIAAVAEQCLEVKRGDTHPAAATRSAAGLAVWLRRAIESHRPTHLLLWNGCQLAEMIAGKICTADVCKRYFEIGNVPGKVFVDSQGVNGFSLLRQTPQLSQYRGTPTLSEFQAWKMAYRQQKANEGVPQSRLSKAFQLERPLDWLASKAGTGTYPMRLSAMGGRARDKILTRYFATNSRKQEELPDRPFYFFPFQVSADTQLLFHSDLTILQAFRRVHEECVADNVDLVVKLHPAEMDQRQAKQAMEQCERASKGKTSIIVSRLPTMKLVESAQRVYTINSTVGLEALIEGKPTRILGRAFYESFVDHPEYLRAYLMRYLIDMDYFSNAPIGVDGVRRVIEIPDLHPIESGGSNEPSLGRAVA